MVLQCEPRRIWSWLRAMYGPRSAWARRRLWTQGRGPTELASSGVRPAPDSQKTSSDPLGVSALCHPDSWVAC